LGDIRLGVDQELSDGTLRNDLNFLRTLNLVRSGGWGRGSYWQLEQAAAVESEPVTDAQSVKPKPTTERINSVDQGT
jgi:predicted transcriptional regulator